jgi:enoyl-CoA hydratase/carnithine racemase
MPVKNGIAEMHDEIAAWRHDIHSIPAVTLTKSSGLFAIGADLALHGGAVPPSIGQSRRLPCGAESRRP